MLLGHIEDKKHGVVVLSGYLTAGARYGLRRLLHLAKAEIGGTFSAFEAAMMISPMNIVIRNGNAT